MTNGVKTAGGDKLGKTIIFAKNHKHAQFIEERFNKNYPEYSGHFLRVIDNYEAKAQDLLEVFCDAKEELNPQIAVSVDMMDTGVDAPRVVNLIFFKQVKSATKYWQMIGRGTRLCPNLFAPGIHKEHFVIFDFCENFEFFEEFPEGLVQPVMKSVSQRIFEIKLEVAIEIRSLEDASNEDRNIAEEFINQLHKSIATLNQERFVVRKELRLVNEYTLKSRWENISIGDIADICNHLSNLPEVDEQEDETARRFDLIVLSLQLALLMSSNKQVNYIARISRVGMLLIKKQNIPTVQAKIETIKAVQTNEFWKSVNITQLEKVRCDLRDLIKFIDREEKKTVYTSFEDDLDVDNIQVKDIIPSYTSMQGYRDRVESYVRKNKDHLVIHKLKTNKPLTKGEILLLEKLLFEGELGTKADYEKEYGEMPLGKFIRSIVGLDIEVANQLFTDFIQSGNLKANQITFINTIISYLTKNGTIDKNMLFESPFTDLDDQGISGIFTDNAKAKRIISIIDEVNENAVG